MVKRVVRNACTYDARKLSDENGFATEGKGLTLQHQKDEADINVIMRKFGVTGLAPVNVKLPLARDGEFIAEVDFQTAMNTVVEATKAFNSLEADVRFRFHNDPGKMLAFVSDKKNLEEARKLGIAVPETVVVPSPPMKVEVVNAAVPPK